MDIGIYHGKQYRIGIIDNEKESLHLISSTKDEGFAEYINTKGKIIENMFIKDTPIRELEDAYELRYQIICQGEKLGLSQGTDHIAETNKILLGTTKYSIAKKIGGFEQADKYYYEKEVPIDEIDSFIEIREPMFQFEETKPITEREIPKEEIMDYAKYMASFA